MGFWVVWAAAELTCGVHLRMSRGSSPGSAETTWIVSSLRAFTVKVAAPSSCLCTPREQSPSSEPANSMR